MKNKIKCPICGKIVEADYELKDKLHFYCECDSSFWIPKDLIQKEKK